MSQHARHPARIRNDRRRAAADQPGQRSRGGRAAAARRRNPDRSSRCARVAENGDCPAGLSRATRHAEIPGRPGLPLSQTRLPDRQEAGAVLCFRPAFGSGGPHPSGHGYGQRPRHGGRLHRMEDAGPAGGLSDLTVRSAPPRKRPRPPRTRQRSSDPFLPAQGCSPRRGTASRSRLQDREPLQAG